MELHNFRHFSHSESPTSSIFYSSACNTNKGTSHTCHLTGEMKISCSFKDIKNKESKRIKKEIFRNYNISKALIKTYVSQYFSRKKPLLHEVQSILVLPTNSYSGLCGD